MRLPPKKTFHFLTTSPPWTVFAVLFEQNNIKNSRDMIQYLYLYLIQYRNTFNRNAFVVNLPDKTVPKCYASLITRERVIRYALKNEKNSQIR